jgi:uncharacterized membrane protein
MPQAQKEIPLLKIAILVLMVALLVSLGSGFYFLMTDQGDKTKRQTFHSLGVRLGIGIALAAVVIYSIATGQLGNRNPWDTGPGPAAATQGD